MFRRCLSLTFGQAMRTHLARSLGQRAMAEAVADGRPPELSPEATLTLITKYFPFKHVFPESFKPLPSYDDRNVYFDGTLEDWKEQFVLKLYNCNVYTSHVLEGLNAVMLYLKDKGFPCCHPIASRTGSHMIQSELPPESTAKVKYNVKVLRFLPGYVMDKLEKRYMTPELFYSLGNMVGRMDLALQDFKHDVIEKRKLEEWDLMNFTDVKEYIPHLHDDHKRQMANHVVAMFEEHIVPVIPTMKRGVIHNDMNGMNILFDVAENKCELSGLIDFGDCIKTCTMFELAIMMAYSMLDKENTVECVAPVFRGYQDVFPLSKEEFNCLYYAVLARLCQSAVNGEYHFTLEPWNTYLLTTPANAWKLIDLLLKLTKERVEEIWDLWRK